MTASTLPLAAEALAALAGFLREIERRAAVFAALACGSAARGDAAVEATLHAFCRAAARGPLPDWPLHFWTLLLASPQVRGAGQGQWPEPFARLAGMGPGVRVALLLRLVAGLDDAQAAKALGVAPATHALALQRALGDRHAPAESARWQALVLASRQQLRLLPGDRLLRLAQARERALGGGLPPRRHRRWRRRWLWVALGACVLAFAASFLLPSPAREATPEVHVAALPPADAPLARFDADTALLTHRDFEQLAAPPAQAALVRDLDFYAWYAAQGSDVPSQPVDIASGAAATQGAHAAP